MKMSSVSAILAVVMSQVAMVFGSLGDSTWHFHKCLRGCEGKECSKISDVAYAYRQPFYLRWLKWSCSDNCDYTCMWKTVEAFQLDGSMIPQFHGKWPFIRVLGVQEPASTVFSVLNGLAHVVMVIILRRKLTPSAPMYYVWHVYAVVALNAWLWSTVFHARDLPFTEMMDYVGAISLVFYSLFALFARVLGTNNKLRLALCSSWLLAFYLYHVHYLLKVKFDYGYNMKVNIGIGISNGVGWIVWCYTVRDRQPYVWKAAVAVFLVSSLVLLELGDFPPLWWSLDAHSLWHASTIPLPVLWYNFIIDDCRYLCSQKQTIPITDTPPSPPHQDNSAAKKKLS